MVLNKQKLEAALSTEGGNAYLPFRLNLFKRVSSTNKTLWELLEREPDSRYVVIAAEQTAGRGQWGRQWVSQKGGLYRYRMCDRIQPTC